MEKKIRIYGLKSSESQIYRTEICNRRKTCEITQERAPNRLDSIWDIGSIISSFSLLAFCKNFNLVLHLPITVSENFIIHLFSHWIYKNGHSDGGIIAQNSFDPQLIKAPPHFTTSAHGFSHGNTLHMKLFHPSMLFRLPPNTLPLPSWLYSAASSQLTEPLLQLSSVLGSHGTF